MSFWSSFVPGAATLLAYTLACAVLALTPGPDMSLWLSKTLREGRAAGIAAMAGTQLGCLIHTVLVAVGLSALLAASVPAFTALKIAGALYLGWLAVQAVRGGSMLKVEDGQEAPRLKAAFWTGLGINLTNPKVVLFFVTFLPQFVAASDPHASAKFLFLGGYFVVLNLPFAIGLVLAAERLVGWLRSRPRVLRGIDLTFAGVFGAFAVKILATPVR